MRFFAVISVIAMFILAACSSNNTSTEKGPPPAEDMSVRDTLISMEKQSWEGWKNNDSSFYANFLSDDHVEVGYSGLSTKAEVVTFVGSKACTVKTYSVDQFNFIRLDENSAALCYHAAQETMCGASHVHSPVWVTSVYVRKNGKWANAIYQQSMNPNN